MRVIIIGGGVIGVSTAYFLAKEGCEVTVLEREVDVARSTSYANGAILTPSMSDPWNAPGVWRMLLRYLGKEDSPLLLRLKTLPSLAFWGVDFLRHSSPASFARNTRSNARLATYSLETIRDLRLKLGLAYDRGPGGTLKITRVPAVLDHLEKMANATRDFGIVFERLDGAGVARREPALAPIQQELAGGLVFPEDESGDAHLFSRALAEAAKALGVRFEFGVEAEDLTRAGDEIKAVRTSVGDYAADAVVVAAGSYSPKLAGALGLRVPVKPVKGYSITVPLNGWNDAPRLPVIDDNYHAVVTPLGNRLRVAGTAEFTGFDPRLTQSRIDNLTKLLLAVYPAFTPYFDPAQISPWAGFRPMSADGVPLVGRSRIANLYLNTGHGHLGWTMAAGSGRLAADLILDRQPEIEAEPYNPMRF